MNEYSAYLLDALEIVSAWDLPDDQSYIDAANQQAMLMTGHFNYDEDNTLIDKH